MCTQYSSSLKGTWVSPDYENMWNSSEQWLDEDLYVLVLGSILKYWESFHCLILVPVGGDGPEPRTMKRMGTVTFHHGDGAKNIVSDVESWTTVTLV